MSWHDYLKPAERRDLERLERRRDEAREAYNAKRQTLKSRAEARARAARKQEDGDG